MVFVLGLLRLHLFDAVRHDGECREQDASCDDDDDSTIHRISDNVVERRQRKKRAHRSDGLEGCPAVLVRSFFVSHVARPPTVLYNLGNLLRLLELYHKHNRMSILLDMLIILSNSVIIYFNPLAPSESASMKIKELKVYDIDTFRSAVIDWLSVGYDVPFTLDRLTIINKKKQKVVWRITGSVATGTGYGTMSIESTETGKNRQIKVSFSKKDGFDYDVV